MILARPLALIYAKLTGVALVWGGSFIAARVVAVEMPAPTAALWRYVIATGTLVVLSLVFERGLPRISRGQVIGVSLLGVRIAVHAVTLPVELDASQNSEDGKVLAVEMVLPPGNDPHGAKWLDLLMLVLAGGRERTEAEWRALLDAGGFEAETVEDGLILASCR